MLNFFETQVEYHRKIIEMFLNEHSSKLQLVAQTHTRDEIIEPGALQTAFEVFNKDLWSLTDLSVIGEHGYHLAYAGPYDLWSRNYSKEFWFTQVMQKGIYISDMFMGFRKEPHSSSRSRSQTATRNGSCGPPSAPRPFDRWWKTSASASPAKRTC